MHQLLKLSHHHHSGRYRPHEHTSYVVLVGILLLAGVILAVSTFSAHATSPPPQAESVGLSGVMPEPPPEEAGVITSPNHMQRFSSSPITVSGTCPSGTLVEILKNNIFAGSTLCRDNGTFILDIDLLIGQNDLVVRVYNAINQPGPNSAVVTVFFDAVPPQGDPLSPFGFGSQLLINTDSIYRGTFPNETLTMPIEIIGGTPPFALEVRWGDNDSEIVPRSNNQPFRISHAYKRPGSYNINLQATDAEGRIAFLTVVAIINGQPPEVPVGSFTAGSDSSFFMNLLYTLWPVFAAVAAMVLSFWMGEQREKRLLAGQNPVLNNQA